MGGGRGSLGRRNLVVQSGPPAGLETRLGLFPKSWRREELAGGGEKEMNWRVRDVPIAVATGQRRAAPIWSF